MSEGMKEYEARGAEKCESIVKVTANMLLVGDRINLFVDQPGAPFGWGTVVSVTEYEVEVLRPYVHTSDFTICAGVGSVGERLMDYIGQERVMLPRDNDRVLTVVFRSVVPK